MSKNEEIIKLFKEYVMPTYAPGIVLAKGKGSRVWDAEGKEYLDFLAGISVLNVGHSHPKVVEAVRKQAGELTHVSNIYYTENEARLAKRLSELALGGKCFFCNSGAEANEALIKLARYRGHDRGKYEVISMENSFHGRTLATLTATGQAKVQKGFDPLPEGFCHAEFNNLESVEALINDKTAAILLEAVQGEGGIVPAEKSFMEGVRKLCDDNDLLMLCDEVQCGMARTGQWFGFQHSGVEPDAFSLAKALGSGYPIGAVVASPKVADALQVGSHATTFGGTPLACASALATIDVIEEEGLVVRAKEAGEKLRELLSPLADTYEHVEGVRSVGLMVGLVLDQPAKEVAGMLMEKGLLTLATAERVVRMLPPLNVTDEDIDEAVGIIDACLAEWSG
jgi:predicted acetylornithine/succinylornithine family transaminase